MSRFGFAYGTLPGHVESGEERFLVEWDRGDDAVWYDILAFSRPNHVLTRLGYPVGEIDNLVVFNGTDGVQDAVLQTLSKGFAALQALRASLNIPINGNGSGGSPGSSPSTQNGSEPAPDGVAAIPAPGREG